MEYKIKNIIKYAIVKDIIADDTQAPLTNVTYLEKDAVAQVITPYGISASLPTDQPCLMFAVNGVEKNGAVIGLSHDKRFKDLEEGEIVLGNELTRSSIKFDKDGNIVVDSKQKVTVASAGEIDITAGANVKINISGDADITANNVNINATQVNLGSGGQPIARVGDAVQVNPGTGSGTIISGGINTSI